MAYLQEVSKWKDLLLKETTPLVVYPEDVHEEEHEVIHPTIGIRVLKEKNRELRPECSDAFPSFELNKSTYLIGKNSRAQFCVRKDTVSQFHARIDYQGEDYYIEDLNSTNGTFVNEEVLSYKSRRRLQSGDRIRFGDVEYRFC